MGGLAGGSADCAGTLIGLRKLWNVDIENRDLLPLAAKLGSDVPFCLVGGTALVSGRGESLEPFPMGLSDRLPDPGAFILVVPSCQVETKGAYDLLDRTRANQAPPASLDNEYTETREAWQTSIMNGDFPALFFNDFENPILSSRPELAALHSHLRNVAGHAFLSGSGSCMFAWLPTVSSALDAMDRYSPIADEIVIMALPVAQALTLDE